MASHFKINGIPIKSPSKFKIERYKVTNSTRTLDGNMKQDLIAKKRKFYFTYEVIDNIDLQNILSIIWETNACFFTLTYEDGNAQTVKSATVYVGSIPSELGYGDNPLWKWKDVTFNLIEQ